MPAALPSLNMRIPHSVEAPVVWPFPAPRVRRLTHGLVTAVYPVERRPASEGACRKTVLAALWSIPDNDSVPPLPVWVGQCSVNDVAVPGAERKCGLFPLPFPRASRLAVLRGLALRTSVVSAMRQPSRNGGAMR